MAAPLDEDMEQFRAWHIEKGGQVREDETGVTTTVDATPPFRREVGSERVEIEVPLGHRFYSRLEHVTRQLTDLGFEILKAETRMPEPAVLEKPSLVHGYNMIYARKPARESQPQDE